MMYNIHNLFHEIRINLKFKIQNYIFFSSKYYQSQKSTPFFTFNDYRQRKMMCTRKFHDCVSFQMKITDSNSELPMKSYGQITEGYKNITNLPNILFSNTVRSNPPQILFILHLTSTGSSDTAIHHDRIYS